VTPYRPNPWGSPKTLPAWGRKGLTGNPGSPSSYGCAQRSLSNGGNWGAERFHPRATKEGRERRERRQAIYLISTSTSPEVQDDGSDGTARRKSKNKNEDEEIRGGERQGYEYRVGCGCASSCCSNNMQCLMFNKPQQQLTFWKPDVYSILAVRPPLPRRDYNL
jgi:hypothetical protein